MNTERRTFLGMLASLVFAPFAKLFGVAKPAAAPVVWPDPEVAIGATRDFISPSLVRWVGQLNNNWSNAGNWEHGEVPQSGDVVEIPDGSTVVYDKDAQPVQLGVLKLEGNCKVEFGETPNYIKSYAPLEIGPGQCTLNGDRDLLDLSPEGLKTWKSIGFGGTLAIALVSCF